MTSRCLTFFESRRANDESIPDESGHSLNIFKDNATYVSNVFVFF